MVSVCSSLAVRSSMLWDPLQVSCRPSVSLAWSYHLQHWALFLFSILPQCPGHCPLPLVLSQTQDLWIWACLASDQQLTFSSALRPCLIQNHRLSAPQTLSCRVRFHLTWVPWCREHTPSSSLSRPLVGDIQSPQSNYSSHQLRWPPRASDAHIGRHFSRHLAASETLSLGEEKGTSHETPARHRGDLKSQAVGLTKWHFARQGGNRPPEFPRVLITSWCWTESRMQTSSLQHASFLSSTHGSDVNFPSSWIIYFPESNCY